MEIEEVEVRTLESCYIKKEKVAHGSFGFVQKGVSRKDPKLEVAIKEVDIRRFEQQHMDILVKTIQREIQFNIKLKEADCPFIVKFIEHFQTDNIVYFIFEFCEITLGGFISNIITPEYFAKRQYILIKVLYEMLLTLKVLENNNLIHRDIKPENILIHKGVAKLGDFGFCRELDQNLTSGRGSLRTTAPESHKSTFYNKCDVWSLGVTIHNCLYGVEPFEQKLRMITDQLSFKEAIMAKEFQVQIRRESKISQILERMIVVQESQRASVEQLLNHPLFKIERLSTVSQWVRGWLIFSSVLKFQKRQSDATILSIVSVAYTQCRVYYQLQKTKSKQIYLFPVAFLIMKIFIKMISQFNGFSSQNLRFIEQINIQYGDSVIQRQIKNLKASSYKSVADGVQKLYNFIASGANITQHLVQLRSLCQLHPKQDDFIKQTIAKQYPDFVIFPALNKILQNSKYLWGLNNIISLAQKQPLEPFKYYFTQKQEYHEYIPIF